MKTTTSNSMRVKARRDAWDIGGAGREDSSSIGVFRAGRECDSDSRENPMSRREPQRKTGSGPPQGSRPTDGGAARAARGGTLLSRAGVGGYLLGHS